MATTQPNLFGGDAYGGAAPQAMPDHDGATYDPALDKDRLNAQMRRVFDAMKPGEWMTLEEVAAITGDQVQSVSARIRDFRKQAWGGHTVNKRRRGDSKRGLFEYQLVVNHEA